MGAKSKVKNICTVQNRSTSPGAIIRCTQWGFFGQEKPCLRFNVWHSLKSQRYVDVLTDTSPVRSLLNSLFHRIVCLRLKKQLCPYQMALRVGSNFGHWISSFSYPKRKGIKLTIKLLKEAQYDGRYQEVIVQCSVWATQHRNKCLQAFLVIAIGSIWIEVTDLA